MEDKTFIIQGLVMLVIMQLNLLVEDDKIKLIGIAEYNGGIFNLKVLMLIMQKNIF